MNIIYENKNYMVVYKPPGLPVQSDLTGDQDLISIATTYMQTKGFTKPYIGLVHRLDRPVGGLVVLAKNPRANKHLSAQLQDRSFKKTYLAVVEGVADQGKLVHYLKKKFKGNVSAVVSEETPKAKKAILDYACLKTIEKNQPYSLVEIGLETGRHHQIRVQMAHIGFPIVNDTKYNPNFQNKKGWYQIALHAYTLSFKDLNNKTVDYKIEPTEEPFTWF